MAERPGVRAVSANRFDEFARTLAEPMPRRRALRTIGGALVAVAWGGVLARPARGGTRVECLPGFTPCGEGCCRNGFICCAGARFEPCCDPALHEGCGEGGYCRQKCPPDWTRCGRGCCHPIEECAGGKCVPKCPPGATRCGTTCCGRGQRCVGGKCAGKCPSGTTPCGATCCDRGKQCIGGTCGCPKDHAPCGSKCCPEGRRCKNPRTGECEKCPPGREGCGRKCCAKNQFCCDKVCCNRKKDTCCNVAPPGKRGKWTCCSKPKECQKQIEMPKDGREIPFGFKAGASNVCCPEDRVSDSGCCPPGSIALIKGSVVPADTGPCCRKEKVCGPAGNRTCCRSIPDPELNETCCGTYCARLGFDPQNCGACGKQCAPDQVCRMGQCEAP